MKRQKYTFMRKILTLLLLVAGWGAFAQPVPYGNEWINFSQTYYKFKVGQTGLYRIPRTTLDAAGIGGTSVQNLELWRNGERVQFSASVSSGPLPANGYIEFWARANDGRPDKVLYRSPLFQHTDKLSLFSDSAVFFLSANTTGRGGALIATNANNVAGNALAPEPYCLYTAGVYFRSQLNPGFAVNVGEYVYSSSYDKGEYWSSVSISPASALSVPVSGLAPYSGVPNATLSFGASGNAVNPRNVKVRVNGTEIKDTVMNYFNDIHTNIPFPVSLIAAGNATVDFLNTSGNPGDQMVVSFFEINYARQFNFGGQKNFEFSLPAKNGGYYLEISNFNAGSTPPVLYDLTDTARYVGDMSVPGLVRFALPGSARVLSCVLVNEEAVNITNVASLTPKAFVNFSLAANQGNFLIITNPVLYTGTHNNNPVDDYRLYRSSPQGGGYQVKVAEIDELTDQFSYGITKHPLSIRNFIRYARDKFAVRTQAVLLIGHGMNYVEYVENRSNPQADQLNLIPTFGAPASDNLLAAANLTVPVASVPIGRLSVISGSEIEVYLDKLKEYEDNQKNAPNTIAGRKWMKNVVHVTGSSDPYLGTILCNYVNVYKQIIQQPQFGAYVSTFCKVSTDPVEQLGDVGIVNLFAEGINFLTYFGHSSTTTLEFNLDNPQNYNNPGKYPVFFINGCNAGNFYLFNPQRLVANETLSEKYVLAKQRGTIAFVASTHFGIVNYLNLFLTNLYNTIGGIDYGKPLGLINRDAMQRMMNSAGAYDFYARCHAEEITLHGDPLIKLNTELLPDYVMEEPQIIVNSPFISVGQSFFSTKIRMYNLGKATRDSLMVEVKRQYPDGSIGIIYRSKIHPLAFGDSMTLNIPIVATRDKGNNKIIVTLDPDGLIPEITKTNNRASKDVFIYQDNIYAVYPYQYAIVNDPAVKFYGSTANPFSSSKNYVMEIDTTAFFNSPLKVSKTVTSTGGVVEFSPGVAFMDSTVYYWRLSDVSATGGDAQWSNSSFIFLKNSDDGFNQSHFFQQTASIGERISLDSASRKWKYGTQTSTLYVRNTMYPTGGTSDADFSVAVNADDSYIRSACLGHSLIFNVFDSVTFKAWKNTDSAGRSLYRYGSAGVCRPSRAYNFEFSYMTPASRKTIMNFMDSIPAGNFVVVRSFDYSINQSYSSTWRGDTTLYGSNNSLYHKLQQEGFLEIDSINAPRAWAMVYKKGGHGFTPMYKYTAGIYDKLTITAYCVTPDTLGYITSPLFGPAKAWKNIVWTGTSAENPTADNPTVSVIGVDTSYNEHLLYVLNKAQKTFDISSINARVYPNLKLKMRNSDSVYITPFQLSYWQLHGVPAPEGAIAPNLYLVTKDTLEIGEILKFGVAFKNISKPSFDSLRVKVIILDKDNVPHVISIPRQKALVSGDTITVRLDIDTKTYPGNNTLYVNVNPDHDQPESYLNNNFLYRNFYVKADNINPVMDVTFDGVHILNRDIVSSKPHIQIKLKDNAKYLLLTDTSLSTVQIRYPDGSVHSYGYNSDTLRFTPATASGENAATVDFYPSFVKQINPDGDEYELIVKGKDVSGNKAGNLAYHVTFKVISKPMISNLLNYPNPFTTSTAFVFTVTGSEIPQNLKIQILTVTGKIIREITKDELGPIHIGRNITEFKWDGTDQYGQRLGNGVYLYRFVASLHGRQMEQYKAQGDNTDQFFTNGYGKMYLMR